MRSDPVRVVFQREGRSITARITTSPPLDRDVSARSDYPYEELTGLLRQRGLECTVEYGLSDYLVHVDLTDGSTLSISPPQEPSGHHPPGRPESWLVTRQHPDEPVHEVLYNSESEGLDAASGGDLTALIAGIDTRLGQLGLPPSREEAAESILHFTGFVPLKDRPGHVFRLPAGMTDPADQLQKVADTVSLLRSQGFSCTRNGDLSDPAPSLPRTPATSLGEQISDLTAAVTRAEHSSDVVAVLSELTAPGTGVLDRTLEALHATADWWEGLGAPADPLYADRLRRVAGQMAVSALEVRSLGDELADRHTSHPQHQNSAAALASGERRTRAATTASPNQPPTQAQSPRRPDQPVASGTPAPTPSPRHGNGRR